MIGPGESFGEDSALNNARCTETVEAAESVETYKISQEKLWKFFGGSGSEVIYALRAILQTKKNWMQLKIRQVSGTTTKDQLVPFLCDESVRLGLAPAHAFVRETPFLQAIQNSVSPKNSTENVAAAAAAALADPKEPAAVHEEDKAPAAKVEAGPPKMKGRMELRQLPRSIKRDEAEDGEKKYDRVMGFETRRVRADEKRLTNMTTKQLDGLGKLRWISNDLKKGGSGEKETGKTDYKKSSLMKFQDRVTMADPIIAEKRRATIMATGGEAEGLFAKLSKNKAEF